jgi:C4-dicarboxylate transporter DctQ subunit
VRDLLRRLDADAERYLMLVFYCTIVFVIVNEVVRRFVLQYSSLWGEEVARYAFIYLGWIGASQAVKERAHIRFDTALQVLPKRWHGYIYIFADLVTLVFACFAIYWSMHSIMSIVEFGAAAPALRISKAYFEIAVPLGFTLMIWRLLQSIRRDIQNIRAGREAFKGALLFD